MDGVKGLHILEKVDSGKSLDGSEKVGSGKG